MGYASAGKVQILQCKKKTINAKACDHYASMLTDGGQRICDALVDFVRELGGLE